MQHNNQTPETLEKETVDESNHPLNGNFTDEIRAFRNHYPPEDDDESDDQDDELGDDDIGTDEFEKEDSQSNTINRQKDLDRNEDEKPDTIDADENYQDVKETDIDQSERGEINLDQENNRTNSTNSEQDQTEANEKTRSVDENGQRINWNDPEISETDGTDIPEKGEPKEGPDQPGGRPEENEIPDDANKQHPDGVKGDPDRMEEENES